MWPYILPCPWWNPQKRLNQYYYSAIDAGADLIFNACSSVGDVALKVKESIGIPLVKIDDAMATTLEPTAKLIQHFARLSNRQVHISKGLAKGAFQAVIAGDR